MDPALKCHVSTPTDASNGISVKVIFGREILGKRILKAETNAEIK